MTGIVTKTLHVECGGCDTDWIKTDVPFGLFGTWKARKRLGELLLAAQWSYRNDKWWCWRCWFLMGKGGGILHGPTDVDAKEPTPLVQWLLSKIK